MRNTTRDYTTFAYTSDFRRAYRDLLSPSDGRSTPGGQVDQNMPQQKFKNGKKKSLVLEDIIPIYCNRPKINPKTHIPKKRDTTDLLPLSPSSFSEAFGKDGV